MVASVVVHSNASTCRGMQRHCDCRDAACIHSACTAGEGRAGSASVEHWGPGVALAAHALPHALQNGSTPLHDAAVMGKTDTVEVLLQHKADIGAKDTVSDN